MEDFTNEEKETIRNITKSVEEKVQYALRAPLAAVKRLRKKATNGTNEYGEPIEDWASVSTSDIINSLSELSAYSFFSVPAKMHAFIESSLAEILYDGTYQQTFLSQEGTVASKHANTEALLSDKKFALEYRKLYTSTITDYLKSLDLYIKRLENIVWMRQKSSANPF